MPPKFVFQSQLISGAIASFRSIVAAVESSATPDDTLKGIIDCQKSSIGIIENLASQFEAMHSSLDDSNMALTARVSLLETAASNAAAAAASGHLGRRVLSESRCVASLKTLGSQKEDFKNWNEKLINATAQTFGPDWRKFMKKIKQSTRPGQKNF